MNQEAKSAPSQLYLIQSIINILNSVILFKACLHTYKVNYIQIMSTSCIKEIFYLKDVYNYKMVLLLLLRIIEMSTFPPQIYMKYLQAYEKLLRCTSDTMLCFFFAFFLYSAKTL